MLYNSTEALLIVEDFPQIVMPETGDEGKGHYGQMESNIPFSFVLRDTTAYLLRD